VAVSKKPYTGITDVPAKSLIYKHKCSSCVDASDCQEVLRIPSVAATLISMPHSVGCVTRGDANDCHKVQVFILVPQQYKSSHQDLRGRAVARCNLRNIDLLVVALVVPECADEVSLAQLVNTRQPYFYKYSLFKVCAPQ